MLDDKQTVYDVLRGGRRNGEHACSEEECKLQLDHAKEKGVDLTAPCNWVTDAIMAGGGPDDDQWPLCRPASYFFGPYRNADYTVSASYYTLVDFEEQAVLYKDDTPVIGWWWCRGEWGTLGDGEINAIDTAHAVLPDYVCEEAHLPIKGRPFS